MAFKKENSFWKARSKHGRKMIFESAQTMWESAMEYFKWCDDNPFYDFDYKGAMLEAVSIPKKRPYSIHGFALFAGASQSFWRQFKAQCEEKKRKANDEGNEEALNSVADFLTVIAAIEDVVYQQKFDGAAAGFFNANIISRDLGLADKKQVDSNIHLSDEPIEFE